MRFALKQLGRLTAGATSGARPTHGAVPDRKSLKLFNALTRLLPLAHRPLSQLRSPSTSESERRISAVKTRAARKVIFRAGLRPCGGQLASVLGGKQTLRSGHARIAFPLRRMR